MSTRAAPQQDDQNTAFSILDGIIAQTRLTPDDEAYGIAKRGVAAFIEELLKPQNQGEPVKKAMVDRMIAQIDAKLSQQMDEIVHHPDFQSLESAWRGLQLLVDRTNFRENIKIEILNVSKTDLLDDFEDSPEVMQSGLYKHVYTAEYGQFGGEPVGAIIANYFMSPSSPGRTVTVPVCLMQLTVEPCYWTKSATCLCRCRPSYCVCCKRAKSAR